MERNKLEAQSHLIENEKCTDFISFRELKKMFKENPESFWLFVEEKDVHIIFNPAELKHYVFASQKWIDDKKLMTAKTGSEEHIPSCCYFVNRQGSLRFVLGDGHHRAGVSIARKQSFTVELKGEWHFETPIIPYKHYFIKYSDYFSEDK